MSAGAQGDVSASVRPTRRHFLILAIIWTAFVAYGSWVPFDYQSNTLSGALQRFRDLPPISIDIGTRADWAANVLLFIPLTFFWMGALVCDSGIRARMAAGALLIPCASLVSFVVELGQFWFVRNPSKNDVTAESLGGIIGVLVWLAEGQRITGWLRQYGQARTATSQLTWLLQAYVVGFVIFSLLPMDLTISVSDLYYKYKTGHVVLVPFSFEYTSLTAVVYQFFGDIVSFVPVGAWLAAREQNRAVRHSPLVLGVAGGFLIAAAIEAAQFLVLSRFTDTTDIVLGIVGVSIGVRLAARDGAAPPAHEQPRGGAATRYLAYIAAYSLFLAIGFWFPFDITTDRQSIRAALDGFFRVPFYALYWGSVFNATTQSVIRIVLFAPLGALCGGMALLARSAASRHIALLLSIAWIAAVALGIELVQVLMPSRVADSTEVMICVAGGLLGLWLRTRVRAGAPEPDLKS